MEIKLIKMESVSRYSWKMAIVAFFCLAFFAALMEWMPVTLLYGLFIIGGAGAGLMLGNILGWRSTGGDFDEYEDVAYGQSVQESKSYDITMHIENRLSRIIHEENPASWRSGIRVKVVEGALGQIDWATSCDSARK